MPKAKKSWLLPASSIKHGGETVALPIPVGFPQNPPPTVPGLAPAPLPAPGTPPVASPPLQMGGMDPLSSTLMMMSANPYMVGMFMLLLNLGGRFLALELTKKQEAFLQATWLRPVLFFTVIFVATRNLAAAFWVTCLFFFLIWVVANENSPFCMIPSWCGHKTDEEKANYMNNIRTLFFKDKGQKARVPQELSL